MKDMMTTIASILVLMIFLMQFTVNQTTYTRMMGRGVRSQKLPADRRKYAGNRRQCGAGFEAEACGSAAVRRTGGDNRGVR